MLRFLGPVRKCRSEVSRRDVLRVGSLAFAGLTLPDILRLRAAGAASAAGRAKSVIMIWMRGGPSHIDSYERICHEVGTDNFLLPLRRPVQAMVRQRLLAERLERAIGVIYRPESELQSHYFYASLPQQFDEYIWFDETSAIKPLPGATRPGEDETYPFGL